MATKALGTLLIKIRADSGQLSSSLKRSQKEVAKWGTKVNLTAGNVAKKLRGSFKKLLSPINALGAALVGAFSLTKVVKAAAEYETALVGVVKTTGLAGKELAKFESDMSGFTKKFAISKKELLGLAQAAGQLGVETKDLAKFTTVMAEMAVASDVAGEEGAKAIARLLTITGGGVAEVDKFTSALVDLGNSAKASESEILHMATMVGQSTSFLGVSGQEVLGLSTAMKELGVRAEGGSSAVGRAMVKINSAIQAGGEEMKEMADLMGKSTDQLAEDFKADAFSVFLEFLDALKEKGTAGSEVLKQFKIAGSENIKVLLPLAASVDTVREKVEQSSRAWIENTARQKEAEIANATFNNQMIVLKNNLTELAVSIGTILLPALKSILSEVNFALSGSERRFDMFGLFLKAKFTEIGNTLGPLVIAVFSKMGADAAHGFKNTFAKLLNESAKFIPFLEGDLPTNSQAPGLSEFVRQTQGISYSAPNPYQDELDAAMRSSSQWDFWQSGVQSQTSSLGGGLGPVKKSVEDVKKAIEDVIGTASGSSSGLPQGGGGIDTTLLGGTGSKDAVVNVMTVEAKVVDLAENLTVMQTELAAFGEQTFDNLTNFVTEFAKNGTVDFKSFATSAVAELAKIQIKALATKAILGLSKSGGGVGGFFGGVASFFGIDGAKADGGPVRGGEPT